MRIWLLVPVPVLYRSILNVLICQYSSSETCSITLASSRREPLRPPEDYAGITQMSRQCLPDGGSKRVAHWLLPKQMGVLASVPLPFVCVIQPELISRVQTKLRQGYRDLSQSLTSHRRSTGDEEKRNLLPDEGTCVTNSFPIYRCVLYTRSWRESAASSCLLKGQTGNFRDGFHVADSKKKKVQVRGWNIK